MFPTKTEQFLLIDLWELEGNIVAIVWKVFDEHTYCVHRRFSSSQRFYDNPREEQEHEATILSRISLDVHRRSSQ